MIYGISNYVIYGLVLVLTLLLCGSQDLITIFKVEEGLPGQVMFGCVLAALLIALAGGLNMIVSQSFAHFLYDIAIINIGGF